jgi:uncharacterized protein YeaO (DUF488 family)
MDICLKRAYEPADADDGRRVLIDRPSTELRQWFGHDPARFDEFRRRYMSTTTRSCSPTC